jgi:hypothetical protein
MSPPRQGVLLWKIPHTQELPQTTQQRCRELLSHLLLAAVNTTRNSVEEESDERKDPTESHHMKFSLDYCEHRASHAGLGASDSLIIPNGRIMDKNCLRPVCPSSIKRVVFLEKLRQLKLFSALTLD